MRKSINLLMMCVFMSFPVFVAAQNGTNSPYTRFGYGELANRSFGAGRSMGGVGIGLRSSKQINPMNPASYSSMDSLTFLFDFGVTGQLSWYRDGSGNFQNDINGNVDYVAMQFPLHKRIAMSIGLLPYSHVGYKYEKAETLDKEAYRQNFSGTGGLNQLYAGLSIDIWRKRLAIGANINYMFGKVDHTAATVFTSGATGITDVAELKVNDFNFDFGVQYTQPLSKTSRWTLGLTYSPKKKLNADWYEYVTSNETKGDTTNIPADIPLGGGIGLSYEKENKLLVVTDFLYQKWKDVKFPKNGGHYQDRLRIAAGLEYIPNLFSRPLYNRIRYRAGLSYSNSYIKVENEGYKELGATVGFGFPIADGRSFINLSFEYMNVKPSLSTMVKENYLKMTVSYTFNELWFYKRKLK